MNFFQKSVENATGMLYNIYEIDYPGVCYAKKKSISGILKRGHAL